MVKPYYQDDAVTIYHADCREILPQLEPVDLVLTDPPYGIGADKNLRANKQHGQSCTSSKDYGVGFWDREPADQDVLDLMVSLARRSIVWGGQYFQFPPRPGWLVWDKDNGDNGYADCELAWTNLERAVRRFRYRWMGMIQEQMGDKKEYRYHPTQKPVDIMRWCLVMAGNQQTILDPFMGSGTTLSRSEGPRPQGHRNRDRRKVLRDRRSAHEPRGAEIRGQGSEPPS